MKKQHDWSKVIGLIRYADTYHPTNEQSRQRWLDLLTQVDELRFLDRMPRAMARPMAKSARDIGYELIFFEKGLGR